MSLPRTTAELASQRCGPCHANTPRLTDSEVRALLPLVPSWSLSAEGTLTRRWTLPDFKTGLALVARVGEEAEAQGHHPDLTLRWGEVTASVWTHAVGGLTHADFVLAARLERL